MDFSFLDYLKGLSPISMLIVVILTVIGLRWARKAIRDDNREALGLQEGETLDSKINATVQSSFTSSVSPILTELRGLTTELARISTELAGLRIGLTNHGQEIGILKLQVAALTGQVGGLPAVHALRARIERKREVASARFDPASEEKKP
jgi:hypothetical protein